MKYLKKFNEKFNWTGLIDYKEIDEIMFGCGLFDEFPELCYYVENSKDSYCIQSLRNYKKISDGDKQNIIDNSFMIEIMEKSADWISVMDRDVLHYIEPRIFKILDEINHHLKKYSLKIFYSEFGAHDISYELIITDKDFEIPIKESSISANKYKYRKDMIKDVKEILDVLKDSQIETEVYFPNKLFPDNTTELIVTIKTGEWITMIRKSEIMDTLLHLKTFLLNDNYKLSEIVVTSDNAPLVYVDSDDLEIIPNSDFDYLILKFKHKEKLEN